MRVHRKLVGGVAVLGALAGPGAALHPEDARANEEEEATEGGDPGFGGGEAVDPNDPGVQPEDEGSADGDTVDGGPGEATPEQADPDPDGDGSAPAPGAPQDAGPATSTPETPPAPAARPGATPPVGRPPSGLQAPRSVPGVAQVADPSHRPRPATRELSAPVAPKATPRSDLAPARPAPRDAGPPRAGPAPGSSPVASAPTRIEPPQTASGAPARPGPTYVVKAGDSLWSIARKRLGPQAGSAQIAREVDRLWQMNAGRIGSGDPSMIRAGARLVL